MPSFEKQARFLTPKPIKPHYPLFIFLPGMDGTGELLRTQVDGLEANFDIRCLSIPPDDLTDWPGLVSQVVALIEAEQRSHPRRPVYLCGESFGGCLALKVAVSCPDCFDRLVLINPASSYNQQPWMRWSADITPWLPSPLYRLSALGLLPLLAALHRISPRDRQELLKAMRSVTQRSSIWRLSLLNDFDVDEAQLQRIQQPVFIIAGAADRLLPSQAEAERLVSQLPDARMTVLPYSGHACLLEMEVNLYQILQQEAFLEPICHAAATPPTASQDNPLMISTPPNAA